MEKEKTKKCQIRWLTLGPLFPLFSFQFFLLNCATPPPMATLLNSKPAPSVIQPEKNGFLAFAPDTSIQMYLRADVKNIITGQVFRLLLTPEPEKGSLPAVVLYQLPVGDYQFTNLYTGYGKKPSMTKINPNPFYIYKSIVTSFGRINITGEEGVMGNIKNMTVVTASQDIDKLIKGFENYGIPRFRIRQLELSLVR